MQIYDKKRRSNLIKISQSRLQSMGWIIKGVTAKSFNYSATKDQVSFMVECIDASVLQYKNLSSVLSYLEGQSESFRNFGVPSVVIMDDEFSSCDFTYILSQNILATVVSNISSLENLDRLVSKTPLDLLPFEYLFAQRSLIVTTAFSQNYKNIGNMQEAIVWAEKAVHAAPRALGGQYRLIQLLRNEGDIVRAASACRAAVRLTPNAPRLTLLMSDLAQELGDKEEVIHRTNSRDESPRKGSASEFLLRGKSSSATYVPEPGSVSNDTFLQNTSTSKRLLSFIFGKRQ